LDRFGKAGDFEKVDEEIADGAGELLNMTFGHSKIKLNELGYAI